MSDQTAIGDLSCRQIALPETRQIEQLAWMLEQRGAETFRCPMVAIKDAPDATPVREWLLHLPFDDLILFTGEGVRRLHGFAQRFDLEEAFRDGLRKARKITRGPKPERALRELGLKSDLRAAEPTTDGLIETLSAHDLRGRRVGVQLYPGNPNTKLTDFLHQAGAESDTVLPYVYVSAAEDDKVIELIDRMAAAGVDVIVPFAADDRVGGAGSLNGVVAGAAKDDEGRLFRNEGAAFGDDAVVARAGNDQRVCPTAR